MEILFSDSQYPKLFEVLNSVHDTLNENCQKYPLISNTIKISTWEIERDKFTDKFSTDYFFYNSILSKGYANQFGKYRLVANNRMIIINTEFSDKAELSFEEYKVIVLHELGHILNYPIRLITQPDFETFKEVFADYYAKKYGEVNSILSTFNKYRQIMNVDIRFLEERTACLGSDFEFEGEIAY